jgi:hypothetical protein
MADSTGRDHNRFGMSIISATSLMSMFLRARLNC